MSSSSDTRSARAGSKRRSSGRASGASAQASVPERATHLAGDAWQSGETLLGEASHLLATVRQGQRELGERLTTGSQARPYLAAGAALGVGFVLGGGLTLGLTRRLIAIGGRFALSMVVRKVVENAGR